MSRKVMTIVRTVLLGLTILNTVLTSIGVVDFGNETANTVYKAISTIAMIGASLWAWWKNNSFTLEAQEADEYLDEMKNIDDNRDPEEIKEDEA